MVRLPNSRRASSRARCARHPAVDQAFGGALEMLAHLGLHVVVELLPAEDGAQPQEYTADENHVYTRQTSGAKGFKSLARNDRLH
jgi:hypothetical protein